MESTDWDLFRAATDSLDEYTDTVTSYIHFCEDSIIPTRTRVIYNNDKPWFTAKLRQLRKAKESAFREGDRSGYKAAKYQFRKELKAAKSRHRERLQEQFGNNDTASVWRGLREITNYKPKAPPCADDHKLADDLNLFFSRFDAAPDTSPSPTPHYSNDPPISPAPSLTIAAKEIKQLFLRLHPRKAPGPDHVSPATLRHCPSELTPVFTDIFNSSLQSCHVPACFKSSIIVPVPKKPRITGLNDYRPVALTSVVMKSFERLVLSHLKSLTSPLLDPLQFAYRANRSVDDAINLALHHILQHLDSPGTYARVLFVDFSSAFNTILPSLLQDKLSQLNVPDSTCRWIIDFLTDRKQREPHRAVFFLPCSSPCTPTTAPPATTP
uniref:Reverse transcriptase domain-containing protein n=1 Tax=Knipowitschia caucasica TaxID=637954 RepID=A0AAV2KND4_KNICA